LSLAADIHNNLSDVGFGHVTCTQNIWFLEYSTSIGIDCFGWGVPLGAGRQPPVWAMLAAEFSSLTWGLVFIALVLATVALWSLPKTLPRWEQQDKTTYSLPR